MQVVIKDGNCKHFSELTLVLPVSKFRNPVEICMLEKDAHLSGETISVTIDFEHSPILSCLTNIQEIEKCCLKITNHLTELDQKVQEFKDLLCVCQREDNP